MDVLGILDLQLVRGCFRGLGGLQVLDGLQLPPGFLAERLQQEGGADHRHGRQGHRRAPHPGLHLESPGGKHAGGNRDADNVVEGSEDKVHPDSIHRLPGQVEAGQHIQEIVLKQ